MEDDVVRRSIATTVVRYAHPGHDRIARESMELRLREDELRDRWKEMGFQLPQVCSDNETPFSLPDPISDDNHETTTLNNHHVHHQQDDGTGDLADEPDSSSAPTLTEVTDTQKPVTSPQPSVTSARLSVTSSVKVRPFELADDDDDDRSNDDRRLSASAYSPAGETPIQREIRLAREREDLLRESRGLPAAPVTHRTSITRRSLVSDSDFELLSGTDASDAAGGRSTSMRQLASTRLAMELEKEKERELDLRRLGCISTISEERRPPSLADDDAPGSHANGHVTGGAWLIEREVKAVEQRELELQMQRARLSVSDDVTSPRDDVINGNSMTS